MNTRDHAMSFLRHSVLIAAMLAAVATPVSAFEISPKKYGDIHKEELPLCEPMRSEEYIQYQEETLPRQFPGVEVFTITEDWR